ncbi:polysaccharide biosynthesis tyrosine autokinase [Salegentibacter sp. JZCK2]|uniref:GumC family protein n=1 Tax=Salegentibacter tibetensis TaxID=2873600 RepID=UPI001CCF0059|nr:polysaccharide biosynthesis tyrosine autokinase [Salegentibacter tibetensis]MBZ9728630.1 polysaccharide biosynthesis tyrosine autokinase [Salegentibacter tibetensis]
MASLNNHSGKSHLEKVNMRKEINRYLKNWPWFLLCLVLCLALAFFYLRYTTPLYNAKATVIIKDESSKGPESAIYADLNLLMGSGTKNIENEIAILRSRRLMHDVVKSLNLHIQYFIEGRFNAIEVYENAPIAIQVLQLDEKELKKAGGVRLEISATDNNFFRVLHINRNKVYKVEAGTPFNIGFADLVIKSGNLEEKFYGTTIVQFSEIEKMASHYRSQISFIQEDNNSNLIELVLSDPVKEKARDILDQLILEFNRSAIEDKNLIAGNTANFINERLTIINMELDSVETGKEIFKEENQLTDIQAESQMFIQNASDYNKKRQEVSTQLELANAMLEYISTNTKNDLLPSNLGLSDGGVTGQIDEYNDLVLHRNRLLAGSSEKNPIVIKLNSQIDQIKGNVMQSLNRMRSNLQISQEDLNRQASSIGSKIYAVPSKERQYRGIERQQSIKETLYLFLLQKREENSLAMAVTEPKAKIVDRAYFNEFPIFPNPRSIYLGSVILGLFFPFSVIYLKGMLDNKIRKRSDIEAFTSSIAVVGEIPRLKKSNELIKINDRSMLAESFRILNTNLQYLLVHLKEKVVAKTLLITSSVKGEGKTFTAINLSITLANTSKRVLLIGADLRSPKLQSLPIDKEKKRGLSDYLVDEDLRLASLISKSNLHPNIDVLLSGSIPPNPYELLKTEKVGSMFNTLKSQYDYIIIDTAPSMLVADTFMLTQYADLVLYMVRAGHTEKELLEFPVQAKDKGRINQLCFVLNNVSNSNLGYGNKYGYGYGVEKKSKWHGFKHPVPS